jgi:hypothetical protein
MNRSLANQWMRMVQAEVGAGRRSALRGIGVRLFGRLGEDLWEGKL